ncbi:MAG: 4Fe-4S ferredoxin, partial [bacterium]
MGIERRDFIKIAGMVSCGLAAAPVFKLFAQAKLPEESPLVAKRWAMVIDLRKCLHQDGCTKCAEVCHLIHNVPDIGNAEEEVKWIWKEPFEHAFHDQ